MSSEIQSSSILSSSSLRIGIVAARFNQLLIEALLSRVTECLSQNGEPEFVLIERVPGSNEIPSA